MFKRLIAVAAFALLVSGTLAGAATTKYTLHPSGFGAHSYSAWKAGEGLPDSTGAKNQALYFQKLTATETFAAGVAVIKGFEGQPASAVLPLSFYWRTDGWCGAGAPRFNVRIQPHGTTDPALRQTVFVGCRGMVPGDTRTAPNGHVYEQRTFAGPLPAGTIVSLAIVYDEGTSAGGLPLGPGFVYLDDIQVGQKVWTSASDNGGRTIVQEPTGEAQVSALLGEPVGVLFR